MTVTAMPKGAAKGRQTQWAAQFLTAAELVRRGYTVSFTMGNSTPVSLLAHMIETRAVSSFTAVSS